MRASPLAPAPLARTRGLPANPDAFRGGLPSALRQEHPPATSEEVQTDSARVRAPQIHFTSPHRTHFVPDHSTKCMMTIAEWPGTGQHPADTARATAMTTSQPPPPVRTTLDMLSAAPRVTETDSPRGEHNASTADNRRTNPPRFRSAQRRRAAVLTPAAAILAAFALLPLAWSRVTTVTQREPSPNSRDHGIMNDSLTCDDPQFPCHRPHHVPLRSTTLPPPATPARHVTTDHVPLLILPTTTRDTHCALAPPLPPPPIHFHGHSQPSGPPRAT